MMIGYLYTNKFIVWSIYDDRHNNHTYSNRISVVV